jgi:hypothetical protein
MTDAPRTIEQRLKKPTHRAIMYSRRVVPEPAYLMVNGRCECSQCIARRAWLAGYRAGRSV